MKYYMCSKQPSFHQAFLEYIEKPSRYLGSEINTVIKDPTRVDVRLALAFPDIYEIGTSHFGLQILYHLLNQYDDIWAERVFAPARDMEYQLRSHRVPLSTLESGTPLHQFDIIGFSLLYELNFTNVLNMLDLAHLPVLAKDRQSEQPFVIAGGPCVCNPEPMADFFDAMVFGDGEEVFLEMVEIWRSWRSQGSADRRELLKQWAHVEGVYIPQFFKVSYDSNGFQRLTPHFSFHTRIRRRIVSDLDQAFFPQNPIVPFGRPVHDRLRLEISRGCTRGCRFCQAGMIYRPVRERSAATLLDLCQTSLAATGYEDVSLLSLSTGDYTCLTGLMENLMTMGQKDRVAVSLPSVRAGTLSPKLMELIRSVRKTGFTIAPEAGSQRLRNVINKNISFDDVATTVQDAFSLGWRVIKLYFMIGLPTETAADIDAIVQMVQQLKRIRGAGNKGGRLNVSVTSFIPKPHTPFQWASQITKTETETILGQFKIQLKKAGVQLKWQHPAMSLLEGALARGDRRLGPVIHKAWQSGCIFDGWSDQFKSDLWENAFSALNLSMADYTHRTRSLDEPLPWRHMDVGVSETFLVSQWQAAQKGDLLNDCRHDVCHQCGVCDFSSIAPQLFNSCPSVEATHLTKTAVKSGCDPKAGVDRRLEIIYSKLGTARFFGHLELANVFARALRRAGIRVRYSGGFHPMPRISFDDPLPLGMESQAEQMRLVLADDIDEATLFVCLNAHLPQGVQIESLRSMAPGVARIAPQSDTYRVFFPSQAVVKNQVNEFLNKAHWPYIKTRANGRSREIDLRAAVKEIRIITPMTLELNVLRNGQYLVRPSDVFKGVFRISSHQLSQFRIIKMAPGSDSGQPYIEPPLNKKEEHRPYDS